MIQACEFHIYYVQFYRSLVCSRKAYRTRKVHHPEIQFLQYTRALLFFIKILSASIIPDFQAPGTILIGMLKMKKEQSSDEETF